MTLKEYYAAEYPLLFMYGAPIRHIGLYQPFASLMRHGKIETRWIKKGKKPPFPLGLYVVYSTVKRYDLGEIMSVSGRMCFDWIEQVLKGDDTVGKTKCVICVGELYMVSKMTRDIELECFVEYKESDEKDLWALRFKRIKFLENSEWNYGKQGIWFVPESEYGNIILSK